MKVRLLNLWDAIRSSYWLVPSLMSLLGVVLAFVAINLDRQISDATIRGSQWIYTGGPEGARGILTAIASSMITVAGVTFSITIVVLTLASSQFGPRLLRNFLRDLGNQIVLGTFTATFVYSLLVLRVVHAEGRDRFVPHLAVTCGLLLSIVSLGVLIYFIHHVSRSIQADNVIAAVVRELDKEIGMLLPVEVRQHDGQPGQGCSGSCAENRKEEQFPHGFHEQAVSISAGRSDYIQAVDHESLLKLATKHDLLLCLENRAGLFVTEQESLLLAWPSQQLDCALRGKLRKAFVLGKQRTPTQDIEFAVHQLVEVAVRALSPGINDPYTAIACIDRLGAALCRVTLHRMPPDRYYDAQGRLRIICDTTTFKGITEAAFNSIRQYGRSSAPVTIRLLEVLTVVVRHARTDEQRDALHNQAVIIHGAAQDAVPEEHDRGDVAGRFQLFQEVLACSTARCA